MTTKQTLIELVELQPWNDTFADMLFEHVYCDCDSSWNQAVAEVKAVREPAMHAYQLAEAARELAVGGLLRGRIQGRIVGSFANGLALPISIVLIEGGAAPEAHSFPMEGAGRFWEGTTVTVGAVWVLNMSQKIKEEWKSFSAPTSSPKVRHRKKGRTRR